MGNGEKFSEWQMVGPDPALPSTDPLAREPGGGGEGALGAEPAKFVSLYL